MTHHYFVFPTASGFCAIAWNDAGVSRFQLPVATAVDAERHLRRRLPSVQLNTPTAEVLAAVTAVQKYFDGERIDFSGVRLDLDGQDELFRQIYALARGIGWGQTTTYGTLAQTLGVGPQAARDVGKAMARNPVPLIIPCHRVLAAGGKIGGFSAPGGSRTKLKMLELEGVRIELPQSTQQTLGL